MNKSSKRIYDKYRVIRQSYSLSLFSFINLFKFNINLNVIFSNYILLYLLIFMLIKECPVVFDTNNFFSNNNHIFKLVIVRPIILFKINVDVYKSKFERV